MFIVFGFYKFKKLNTLKKNKSILLNSFINHNIRGTLIISKEGWMNAAICWKDRPQLTGNPSWHTDAPEADRVKAFDTYISYGGKWTLENDVFTTQVEFSLNPGWVGGSQKRGMKVLPNNELLLTLSRAWPNGRVMNGWVRWRRAEK